jgi:ABC-type glutathione transport system ATPase component
MPESKQSAVLQVKKVSNVYSDRSHGLFGKKTDKSVLDNVSFTISTGEVFGLVGESGCGKTTLANSILGFVKHSGEILLDGRPRESYSNKEAAGKVQAVFQDPSGSLNPAKRIGWILEEPLRVASNHTKSEREHRVDEVLDLVGLDPSYKQRRPMELSGGQKQRVCIGYALMRSPKLIIADEAVSALDVSIAAQILNLLQDLHKRLGLSLLFISHNLSVVYYLCDTIAVMSQGRIVEIGTASDIYNHPQDTYTQTLLRAVPTIRKDNSK